MYTVIFKPPAHYERRAISRAGIWWEFYFWNIWKHKSRICPAAHTPSVPLSASAHDDRKRSRPRRCHNYIYYIITHLPKNGYRNQKKNATAKTKVRNHFLNEFLLHLHPKCFFLQLFLFASFFEILFYAFFFCMFIFAIWKNFFVFFLHFCLFLYEFLGLNSKKCTRDLKAKKPK